MKRILSLFLAIMLVLSLAACKNAEPPLDDAIAPTKNETTDTSPTDKNQDNNPTTDSTTNPSDHATDVFVWETKVMDRPSIAELETTTVTLNTTDNKTLISVLVNPSIHCEFSDDFKAQIKASPLLKDWVFANTVEESGAPVSYSNIDGLRYTYEYEEAFSAKIPESATNIFDQFFDFSVSKKWETQNATNFNRLSMSITLQGDMLNANAQDEILNLLKIVFGDEIGEYLCYADAADQYGKLCIVKQNASEIIFSRDVDLNEDMERCDIYFSVYTRNAGTTYDCVSCDYAPVADFSNLNALLGDGFKFDPMKYDVFGESIMSKHFKDYLGMETDSKGIAGYTYQYTKAENGFVEETFTVDGDILQKDVVRMLAPEFRIYVLNKYQDNDLIYTKGNLQFSTGCSDETDQTKLHQMFDSHGFAIMEALIPGDQQVAANMKLNDNGNFDTYTTSIAVMDKEVEANFNYKIGTDYKSGYQGFITIGWYKDLR